MKKLARELRKQATDAERLLWKHLRSRQLAGYKFRRQHIIGSYIVDFICLDVKLIVEADGGQHIENKYSDEERTVYLESLGYQVIRFWNHEILCDIDAVLERIHSLLNNPSPQPSPKGRGSR